MNVTFLNDLNESVKISKDFTALVSLANKKLNSLEWCFLTYNAFDKKNTFWFYNDEGTDPVLVIGSLLKCKNLKYYPFVNVYSLVDPNYISDPLSSIAVKGTISPLFPPDIRIFSTDQMKSTVVALSKISNNTEKLLKYLKTSKFRERDTMISFKEYRGL